MARSYPRIQIIIREWFKWDPSGFLPGDAVVNAMIVTAPLVVGVLTHNVLLGATAAIGALLVGFTAFQGGYRTQLTTMASAGVAVAVGLGVGDLCGGSYPALVSTYALLGMVGGLSLAYGIEAGVIGTQAIVAFAIGSGLHTSDTALVVNVLPAALVGAGMQVGATTLVRALRRFPVERRALRDAFQALAAYAAQQQHHSTIAPEAITLPQLTFVLTDPQPFRRPETGAPIIELAELAERIRTRLPVLRLTADYYSNDALTTEILNAVGDAVATACLLVVATLTHASSSPSDVLEAASNLARLASTLDKGDLGDNAHWTRAVHPLLVETDAALKTAQRLKKTERPVAIQSPASTNSRRYLPFTRPGRTTPSRRPRTGPLWRHAVRLALALVLAEIIVHQFDVQHGYWAPMTVALVLKPEYASTIIRGAARMVGTFVGIAFIALLILVLPHNTMIIAVVTGVVTWAGMAIFRANYASYTALITAVVVLLFVTLGAAADTVAPLRLVDTIIGGTIALLLYAVWPTWEGHSIPAQLADLLTTQATYTSAVLVRYCSFTTDNSDEHPPEYLMELLRNARNARAATEASTERMAAEPARNYAIPVAIAQQIVTQIRRNSLATLALHAHLGDPDLLELPGAERFSTHLYQALTNAARTIEALPTPPRSRPGPSDRSQGVRLEQPSPIAGPLTLDQSAWLSSVPPAYLSDSSDLTAATPFDPLVATASAIIAQAVDTIVDLVAPNTQ
ncbi:MAG: FUSC family protein [Ferrimicrobium sp.]